MKNDDVNITVEVISSLPDTQKEEEVQFVDKDFRIYMIRNDDKADKYTMDELFPYSFIE